MSSILLYKNIGTSQTSFFGLFFKIFYGNNLTLFDLFAKNGIILSA